MPLLPEEDVKPKPLTRDEFLDGVDEMLTDFGDPDSNVSNVLSEMQGVTDDVRPHDPVMAELIVGIGKSMQALKDHAERYYAAEINLRRIANDDA